MRHIADTHVDYDAEIRATLTETEQGIAFDFFEDFEEGDERFDESIGGVEVPFSVLADMARQYMRGENWLNRGTYEEVGA